MPGKKHDGHVKGDDKQIAWTEVFAPLRAEPGSDLMLLHPDGSEETMSLADSNSGSRRQPGRPSSRVLVCSTVAPIAATISPTPLAMLP